MSIVNKKCRTSKQDFEVTDLEQKLRMDFGFENLPDVSPQYRFQELGAFWPHWNLHNRKSNKSGKNIVSIFPENCPYPVWERDEWIAEANPPRAEYDVSKSFFDQAWELFQKCPIPHNFQSHNQNCEYTDDWYHSKNCYLCHSGQYNEDVRYSYGCDHVKDIQGGVLSFESELCSDLIYCRNCFNTVYSFYCRNLHDCSFMYDCRSCKNCMFCTNLRNKEYCFANQQLAKEEYEAKVKEWNLSSHVIYEKAKEFFESLVLEHAWHKALLADNVEDSTGSVLAHTKDCQNCYMLTYHEDCVNVAFSGPHAKTLLDSLGTVGAELGYFCSLPVFCYQTRFCFSTSHCRFVDYSAYCFQCENCFGCCGLVGKKYCILNKQYTKEEYEELLPNIIQNMKDNGEFGKFFPGHFAPNSYGESWSGYHFPLSREEQATQGFRVSEYQEQKDSHYLSPSQIPDSIQLLNKQQQKDLQEQVFWDQKYRRPFKIYQEDIDFSKKMNIPLPHRYYMNRIQSNFRWIPFTGELRSTACPQCSLATQTAWPDKYDGKILCDACYNNCLYN